MRKRNLFSGLTSLPKKPEPVKPGVPNLIEGYTQVEREAQQHLMSPFGGNSIGRYGYDWHDLPNGYTNIYAFHYKNEEGETVYYVSNALVENVSAQVLANIRRINQGASTFQCVDCNHLLPNLLAHRVVDENNNPVIGLRCRDCYVSAMTALRSGNVTTVTAIPETISRGPSTYFICRECNEIKHETPRIRHVRDGWAVCSECVPRVGSNET